MPEIHCELFEAGRFWISVYQIFAGLPANGAAAGIDNVLEGP
jgi:hypothetical protein